MTTMIRMRHRYVRLHALTTMWHYFGREGVLAVLIALLIVVAPTSAAMRFQGRSLYMNSTVPGETTSYKVSFSYMSPDAVGSVDMLFCIDPIPYHPCVTPPGLDVSSAELVDQSGESNFAISSKSTNHLVLSRSPQAPSSPDSSYVFENIVNPEDSSQAFAIRLRSHASTNASGPQIDFGSVRGQVTDGVEIMTQVPPMLIFCVAEEVNENCSSTSEINYSDMGQLDPNSTLVAQSQMAVGTNASGGFAITANGPPLSAGTNVLDAPEEPTESLVGQNQFGINLTTNDQLSIGNEPEGEWANAVASPDYSIPNMYKYVPGDVVAYSPNVSLMRKFTVSYVVNSRPDLRAGVYTTTITYIASGRF